MSGVPLAERLRRKSHRAVGVAQDILMVETYAVFPEAVLHGGTAIWRCYGGGRFSEDIDVYLPGAAGRGTQALRNGASAKGLTELKFKETVSTIYAKFSYEGTAVSIEGAKRPPSSPAVVRPYEMLDGSKMLVNTLSPESLLLEKAAAYTSRRKVRDLYDVFFLSALTKQDSVVTKAVRELLDHYAAPVDQDQLRSIVIAGTAPRPEQMLEGLRRWARSST